MTTEAREVNVGEAMNDLLESGQSKASVSLPTSLLEEARRRGQGNLSAYVREALLARVQRDRLFEVLAAQDVEYGPVPEELLDAARRALDPR